MLKITPYQETDRDKNQWDSYVLTGDNGTIFHQRSFLNYHPSERFRDASVFFYKREKIIGLLPAALIIKDGQSTIVSHPGASWGGFVYNKPLSYKQAVEVIELTLSYASELNCRSIEITLPPAIYQSIPTDVITFCMLQKGFRYKKRELTSVIDMSRNEWDIDRSVRKAVNKSQEMNIRVLRDVDDWERFYKLLALNLAGKGKKPTHSLKELLYLKEVFPGQIELWSAYSSENSGNKYVGGLCNWEVKKGYWLIFYSCYEPGYQEARILNRLFYECCSYYRQKGASFVDFGTCSINQKVNEGLIRFKELYSAYGVFRDTLSIEL